MTARLARITGRQFRPRRRVIAALGAVLIVVAVFLALLAWGVRTQGKVRELASQLSQLEESAGGELASADRARILSVIQSLEEVQPAVESLRSQLGPVRVAAAIGGWLPGVGSGLRAAPVLVDRAGLDVDSAIEFARAVLELRQAFSVVAEPFDDLHAAYVSGTLDEQIAAATARLSTSDELLARAEVLSERTAAERLSGTLREDAESLARQETRLRALLDWTRGAAETAHRLGPVVIAARPLLSLVEAGGIAAIGRSDDLAGMLSRLLAAADEAYRSAAATSENASDEITRSTLGRDLRALEDALLAVRDLAQGADTGLAATRPVLDLFAASEAGLLSDGERLLEGMDMLAAERGAIAKAVGTLELAQRRLADASVASAPMANGLVERVADLENGLRSALILARDLPVLAGPLLARDGVRTHLVLGQTSDELRASGGFVSGAWLVTFNRGALVDARYIDIVELDDLDNLALYPRPPQLLEENMAAPVWLMRDVGWEPDFPATAQIARELFRLGQHAHVDGVIAVTPWAFLDLADALGEIQTDDGPIPADRLLSSLESGTDAQGRGYMDTLFQGLLDTLDARPARGLALELARALETALSEKQILINLVDPNAQEILRLNGWDGALTTSARDRVVAIDSNVGWSKVDRNIERQTSYRIAISKSAPARARLTLGYTNNSGPNATGCDSQWMDRGSAYQLLKNTCYWDLVRAYVAPGAQLVSADRMPLPAESIVAQSGLGAVGEDTLQVQFGPGGTIFAGLQTVPPGESRTITFVYDIPRTVIDWDSATPRYTLSLQVQPGTRGRRVTVQVVLPEGYEYADGSPVPGRVAGGTVEFDFNLMRDTTIVVDMRPARAG